MVVETEREREGFLLNEDVYFAVIDEREEERIGRSENGDGEVEMGQENKG